MSITPQGNSRRSQRGQILPLLALLMSVMIIFVGMGIDLGFAYVTKAGLSKAVDAAALSGMRNLSLGQAQATAIAQNVFNANYPTTQRDAGSPSVSIAFTQDASNNTVLTVNALATINTFFIRILPEWRTMRVAANAQTTRSKLIMSLVLDRSGSMLGNGGSGALPPAVGMFVNLFDDNMDRVAMVSFASNATTDVTLRTGFKAPITNAANAMPFGGGTFGPGGLTLGLAQNNSVAVAPGENVEKVVVYFTDGWPNIIQDTLACGGAPTLRNYGGTDAGTTVFFFSPPTGSNLCSTSGGTPPCCPGVNKFTSAINGSSQSFLRQNVTNDALYRAVQTTNTMRSQGMTVYSIGLGNNINQNFLRQIANDPASTTFNPNQPAGQAVFATNCPSATCTSELQQVFQTIAAQILLRLTQ